jgi:hypothetical protein
MDPAAEHVEQWARVRALLGEALELDAPAQLRFVDSIEDPVLRAEVKSYLAWVPAADDPLDQQQPWGAAGIPVNPLPGTLKEGSRLATSWRKNAAVSSVF